MAQAFSALIALVTAFVAVAADRLGHAGPLLPGAAHEPHGRGRRRRRPAPTSAAQALRRCVICERDYEAEDMAALPGLRRADLLAVLHAGRALRRPLQAAARGCRRSGCALLRRLLPRAHVAAARLRPGALPAADGAWWRRCWRCCCVLSTAQELRALRRRSAAAVAPALRRPLRQGLRALLLVAGMVAWWLVLAQQSRQVAQEESQPPDPGADAARSNRTAAPTHALQQAEGQRRPTPPTRPRAATSPPSATSCARR